MRKIILALLLLTITPRIVGVTVLAPRGVNVRECAGVECAKIGALPQCAFIVTDQQITLPNGETWGRIRAGFNGFDVEGEKSYPTKYVGGWILLKSDAFRPTSFQAETQAAAH